MEKEDKIAESVQKVLQDLKDEHELGDGEIASMASLISSIIRSSVDMRLVFYKAIYEVASYMKGIINSSIETIKKKNGDDDGGEILN